MVSATPAASKGYGSRGSYPTTPIRARHRRFRRRRQVLHHLVHDRGARTTPLLDDANDGVHRPDEAGGRFRLCASDAPHPAHVRRGAMLELGHRDDAGRRSLRFRRYDPRLQLRPGWHPQDTHRDGYQVGWLPRFPTTTTCPSAGPHPHGVSGNCAIRIYWIYASYPQRRPATAMASESFTPISNSSVLYGSTYTIPRWSFGKSRYYNRSSRRSRALEYRTRRAPGIAHWWDLQSHHATFQGPRDGHGYNVLLNDDVPSSYLDVNRYTTPGGLGDVMR